MSSFIPLPPTYAIADPQVRSVLDVLTRNMQVVIDAGGGTTTNTALTLAGGASTFGSGVSSTNITNLAPSYTLDTLTADLKRGAAEVITGVTNGTTVMKLEPAGQYVVFQHKDAVVLGTTGAYAGTIRTGLGITSTGILGGFNRTSDGAWQTTFAIESSTGNLTLLGTIRAASVISVDALLGSTLVSTVVANAASVTTKLNKSAADILSGTIEFQSAGGFKTGTIAVDGSGNVTGAGVAITSRGIVGRNAGATTFTIDADTGAATFKGDITGASGTFTGSITGATGNFSGNISGGANIDITGNALFKGAFTIGAATYAAVANSSFNALGGFYGYANSLFGYAMRGAATSNGGGGYFTAEGATDALDCFHGISSSYGLGILQGRMYINNSTMVTNLNANYLDGYQRDAFATSNLGLPAYAAQRLDGSANTNVLRFVQGTVTGSGTAGFSGTNKPGGASNNVWMQITIDSTTLYIPVWT